MKISNLIDELHKVQNKHGDIEVAALGSEGHLVTNIYVDTNGYYYDGGCLYWDEQNKNWLRTKFHPELGSSYCYILGIDPNMGVDCSERFEGHLIPSMGVEWDEEKYKKNKDLFKKIYSGEIERMK